MPDTGPELGYAPAQRKRRLSPQAVRWLVIGGALLALLPLMLKFASRAVQANAANRAYRACAAYRPPQVAYSESDAEIVTLGGSSARGYAIAGKPGARSASHVPAPWAKLAPYAGEQLVTAGTLYLGECKTPAGTSRLVAVDLVNLGTPAARGLAARTLAPGTTLSFPRRTALHVHALPLSAATGELRVLSGESDRNDPTHFTIAYTIDGRAGVIDGWVNRDESVLLEARGEPASMPSFHLAPPPPAAP